mmetsp:Transcript_13152/g.38224  ORF Transcript_13152/g.38224 Transcript_13152/m.38224 type:complete len:213 (+) Transcript_13152:444-1082(+)
MKRLRKVRRRPVDLRREVAQLRDRVVLVVPDIFILVGVRELGVELGHRGVELGLVLRSTFFRLILVVQATFAGVEEALLGPVEGFGGWRGRLRRRILRRQRRCLRRLRDRARAGVLARRGVDLLLGHRRRVDDLAFRHEPRIRPFLLGLALLRSRRIQGRLPRFCGPQEALLDGGLLLPLALVDVVGDVEALIGALDDGAVLVYFLHERLLR